MVSKSIVFDLIGKDLERLYFKNMALFFIMIVFTYEIRNFKENPGYVPN